MKSILLSIKPEWLAKILNGEKTIEVRTSKALAKAIQKLIDKYGYAEIYGYCTKDEKQGLVWDNDGKGLVNAKLFPYSKGSPEHNRLVNGKVAFKFRCYKVEEIELWYSPARADNCVDYDEWYYETETLDEDDLLYRSCLSPEKLANYLCRKNNSKGYAIHISQLKIFDKPKELSEFDRLIATGPQLKIKHRLTKAPQNYCYIEGE